MDLVAGTPRVIVITDTSPKTARRRSSRSATCRSPARTACHRIITDLAVFDVPKRAGWFCGRWLRG